jgi:hypothetical protein
MRTHLCTLGRRPAPLASGVDAPPFDPSFGFAVGAWLHDVSMYWFRPSDYDAGWKVTQSYKDGSEDGSDSYKSAQSGQLENTGKAGAKLKFESNSETQVSFDWAVESSYGSGYINIYIDGDRVVRGTGGDNEGFASKTLVPGSHTLLLEYSKPDNNAYGADAAWIKNLDIGDSVGITKAPVFERYPELVNDLFFSSRSPDKVTHFDRSVHSESTRLLKTTSKAFPNGSSPAFIAVGAGYVFVAGEGDGTIYRAPLASDGTAGNFSPIASAEQAYGMAVAPKAEKVYWSRVGYDTLHRANIDGSGVEKLLETNSGLYDLAVDEKQGILFFNVRGELRRAALDASGASVVVSQNSYIGVALDRTREEVYLTAHERVYRTDYAGTFHETVTRPPSDVDGVAFDPSTDKIFLALSYDDEIRSLNRDGGGLRKPFVPNGPRGVSVTAL